MIDETKQEQACLYALGALENADKVAFEQELAQNAELRELTINLQETSASLALSVANESPSPEVKERVLSAVRSLPKNSQSKVISLKPRETSKWLPWALAACLLGLGLYQTFELYFMEDVLSKVMSNVESLKRQDQISQMRISIMSSLLEDTPKMAAVSLWDNEAQKGVFIVENLKPLPDDKDYQLWVINSSMKSPVSAGVFHVDEKGTVRYQFRPDIRVPSVDKFAVTIERRGGVVVPEGKMVLLGQ